MYMATNPGLLFFFFFCKRRKVQGEKDRQKSRTEERGYTRIPTLLKVDPVPFKRLNLSTIRTTQQLLHQLES